MRGFLVILCKSVIAVRKMLTLIWIIVTTNLLCVQGTHLMHVPCDDKVVEKLSHLATTYINEDRKTGYKFALNRVSNVQAHPQVGKLLFVPVQKH